LSQNGKDLLLLNKSMTAVHISLWIIKVFAPCLRLMGDTLRNILLDRVSMQFFLSLSSMLIYLFFIHLKMFYKIWTHKFYINGFSFTTWQVGQQQVSLEDMTLDRESPNRSCLCGSDLNTSTWFAPSSDKRSWWNLIWVDFGSSGFIMPSTFPDLEEC
jgi:hypothetical protein